MTARLEELLRAAEIPHQAAVAQLRAVVIPAPIPAPEIVKM